MPVILPTDALVFLLLAVAVGFGLYASRREHLCAPWRRVLHKRVAMVALVVLGFYVAVGLLDTMHFHPRLEGETAQGEVRYASNILSVFDIIAAPLRNQGEKTYSAPFASHLYAKETVKQADGTEARVYPALKYGGQQLRASQSKLADILTTSLLGLLEAAGIWLLLTLALVWRVGRRARAGLGSTFREVLRGRHVLPWHALLITLAVMLALTFISANLALDYHILGTDKVGEDVFYQALKSIRTGLVIGTLTTLVMLPFAILLGIMAGYFRGWVDDVIQYIYTTLNSIPGVLLIAAAVLMLDVYMNNHAEAFNNLAQRADLKLLSLCLILGVTSWTSLCRLLRGETFKLREVDYIQAAAAFGVRHFTIILRHILPNVMHIILITVVIDFSGLVLAEAVLSYIGIGVAPTTNSWGNMINSARLEMAREPIVWWSLAAAFVFMFTLVLFANLLSDVVRDAFDPRLRETP